MVLRNSIAVIGLVVASLWNTVPLAGQRPKDIELQPGALMIFADGMAISYTVRNKAKKPVWVMFEADGPAGTSRCSTIRKLEPATSKRFHCTQPSITPGAAYPLSVSAYADERFGNLLAWYNGSLQIGEKDLEFVRKSTQGAGINATAPPVDSGDDAASSPPLPAAFEGTWYRIPPKDSSLGGRLKSGFASAFSFKGHDSGTLTVETDALVFKNDEKALRIPFAGITSVGLEIIPPGEQEWIVVRFVGDDRQPDAAAFRNAGRRSGAGDTGMMLLTLHGARRK